MAKKTTKNFWVIGSTYFIRTVTNYFTGRLESITDSELVMADAAWIADTGRFADAIGKAKLNEVEPYPDRVLIGRGAIVDACTWDHDLPRGQL